MLRVLLLNPFQSTSYSQPPIGLALLAAVLEREGYPVTVLEANALKLKPEDVVPLARCRDEVILAREGRVLVSSYHPEISGDLRVHRYFLGMTGLPGDEGQGP